MYASIKVSIKNRVESDSLKKELTRRYGNSVLPAKMLLENRGLQRLERLAVCAAENAEAEMVYLLLSDTEINVIVYGANISVLKENSMKCVRLLKKIDSIRVVKSISSIMISSNANHEVLAVGEEKTWFGPFLDTLADRFVSKVVSAIVTALAAVSVFPPTSTPIFNALIGVAATLVGVLFEAIQSAWRANSWTWREAS